MTADCYSYPIPAILIMSGISLRVSTHLSFHADPTAISYLQVIPSPVPTGKQLVYMNMPTRRAVYTRCSSPHYIQGYVPVRRTSLPNLELRDSVRRKSFGIATRAAYLSDRVCAPPSRSIACVRDPPLCVTSLLKSRHCFTERGVDRA